MDQTQTEIMPPAMPDQQQGAKNSKLQLIVLVVACVLLGLAVLFGIASGFSTGRSRATLASAQAINQALKYYSSDQGRYPSADQYYNQRILVPNYMQNLPLPQDGSCSGRTDFIYSQDSPDQYRLEFCLTASAGGFGSGVHAFTEKGSE